MNPYLDKFYDLGQSSHESQGSSTRNRHHIGSDNQEADAELVEVEAAPKQEQDCTMLCTCRICELEKDKAQLEFELSKARNENSSLKDDNIRLRGMAKVAKRQRLIESKAQAADPNLKKEIIIKDMGITIMHTGMMWIPGYDARKMSKMLIPNGYCPTDRFKYSTKGLECPKNIRDWCLGAVYCARNLTLAKQYLDYPKDFTTRLFTELETQIHDGRFATIRKLRQHLPTIIRSIVRDPECTHDFSPEDAPKRAKCKICLEMLGLEVPVSNPDSEVEADSYTKLAPNKMECRLVGLREGNTKKGDLIEMFRSKAVVKAIRIVAFGATDGSKTPVRCGSNCHWRLWGLEPGDLVPIPFIVGISIMLRFLLSADTEFSEVGNKTKTPYFEDYLKWCRLLEADVYSSSASELQEYLRHTLFGDTPTPVISSRADNRREDPVHPASATDSAEATEKPRYPKEPRSDPEDSINHGGNNLEAVEFEPAALNGDDTAKCRATLLKAAAAAAYEVADYKDPGRRKSQDLSNGLQDRKRKRSQEDVQKSGSSSKKLKK